MAGALDDISVLEIANWVAGPSAGAIMADMGADVIKVEPLAGDSMRGLLRQPELPEGAPRTDVPFHLDNRGKRSLAVDLGDPRGGELVRDLARTADVVITNLLPRRLERYGLGAEQLREVNPRLVYALVTGYGSTGEDADRIAFDLTAFFGRGAVMSLIGEPGEPPPAFRPGQGDHPTGLALLSGILAALRVRDRTGEGQVVETALMRTAAWTIGCDVAVALVDGQQPNKRARDDAFSPMNTRFRCADGWINLSTFNQGLWSRFCDAVERPELADDERFATPQARFRNNRELIHLLDEVFVTRTVAEWTAPLDSTGIIWGPVAELPDLVADPQAEEMGMWVEVEHPEAGRFRTMAAPFTLSDTPLEVRGVGPEIGEHTQQVLAERGIDADRVAALRDAGVLGGS
ncbi:CaiB/BaiF CoA transferase family protein [Actinomarinicola tropica]|uniref:CoA transferase n=1 Tax=Actinomarinicola tropica TaxID=2789776 RepID=A0A5Q2RJA5_9ACTN|nr:CoA transferase [Actinomarinicola tropica]QGG96859.1 CoA transferase [Actinomarinicola tropica]